MRPRQSLHHHPTHYHQSIPKWKRRDFGSTQDILMPQYEIPSYYHSSPPIVQSSATMTNPNLSSSSYPSSTFVVSSKELTSICADENRNSTSSPLHTNHTTAVITEKNQSSSPGPSLSPPRPPQRQQQHHQYGFKKNRKNFNSSRKHSDLLSYARQVQATLLSTDSPESLEKYLQERRNRFPCASLCSPSSSSSITTYTLPQSSNEQQERRVSPLIEVAESHLTTTTEGMENNDDDRHAEETSLKLRHGNNSHSDRKHKIRNSHIDPRSRNPKIKSLLFNRPSLYQQVSVSSRLSGFI